MNRYKTIFTKHSTPYFAPPTVRKVLLSSAILACLSQSPVEASCSLPSSAATNINFTNSSTTAVKLIWVDENCVERLMTTLASGSKNTQPTWKSHVWLTRKVTDNSLVTETQVITDPVNVVIKDPVSNATLLTQISSNATLTLAPAKTNPIFSPPNTPFIDPMPVPPVLTPVTAPNPLPNCNKSPSSVPGRVVQAKLNGTTVASANIGGFSEAQRPEHQRWMQFGGVSETAPGFTGDFYESVEMEVPWDFYPKADGLPASKVWTFVEASTGAIGPIRIKAQYGRPVIHRIHNALPSDNGGFGINQTSTHLHNGHTASESDGGPTQFYDAGQFKDFHYANVRAGFSKDVPTSTFNGKTVIGDVKETMSSLWFHDHRFDFTTQNVYKGLVSFYSLFSNDILLDTDDERTGLRLPSGKYDVPMIFIDMAFSPKTGLRTFDTTNIDGVLGDKYTVNMKIQPYFNVEKRKYRFRLLDGGPSRYYEFFLSNGASFVQLSTNGNLLPAPITTRSIRLGVAERADVIVDFTNVAAGSKVYLQNKLEQLDGRGPTGKIITPTNLVEFRVQSGAVTDDSRIPTASQMLPLPNKNVAVARSKVFNFSTSNGAWTVNGQLFDPNTTTNFVKVDTAEKWTLGSGGGWAHPAHIHFEEGQILARNGKASSVADDIGRKDVYRIGQAAIGTSSTGTLDVFYKFRDFLGTYPVHCHNVVHEDHAMMTQFEIVP